MPPAKIKVEIGMQFNSLTVIAKGIPTKAGHPQWDCRCICGEIATIRQSQLEQRKSCGCLARQRQKERQTSHGMFGTPEHHAWTSMKGRCQNPKDKGYHNYGGRGITVCERWQTFENFIADMGLRPSREHSLDRINVNGNYEPSNCRWATKVEQARNRRTNTLVTYSGETLPVVEWCERLGADYQRVIARMSNGETFEDAISLPANYYKIRKFKRVCRECGSEFERGHSARYCEPCSQRREAATKRRWREEQSKRKAA